jgi:hypothetical protein
MSGLQDPETVDVVAHDPHSQEYLLVMVEDRPWGHEPGQAQQLRAKINAYVGFVVDGRLQRHYPETAGERVRLQLDCYSTPSREILTIIDHANAKLGELSMRLTVNVRD